MKKIIFLLCFSIILFIKNSNSQIIIGIIFGDKLNTEYLQMGLSVGDNFTSLTNIEGENYAHNFTIGLDLRILPKKKISIHSGIFFSSPAGKKGLSFIPTGDENLDAVLLDTDVRIKLNYVSLPVYAKYTIWKGLSLETGASFSYMRKAKLEHTHSNSERSLNYTENIEEDFNKFDILAGIGLGYTLKNGKGIGMNIRYVHGLLDIVNNPALKEDINNPVFNTAFQFLVEIPIKGDKEVEKDF